MITSRAAMNSLLEDDLRSQVIMPLMRKMGFRDVHESHASVMELGKDIVAWKEGEFGNRINTAVVAKIGRISGRTAQDVGRQIALAFNAPFPDPITLEEQRIHNAWVVTNGSIPTDSMPGIKFSLDAVRSLHVTFIDGDTLWEQWCRYFPVATHQAVAEARARISEIDKPYRVEVSISSEGQEVTIGERYPGQLEEEPLEIKARFEAPDTPEGQELMDQIDEMFATGALANIPAGHFFIDLPEPMRAIYQQIFGEVPDGSMAVTITSIPGTKVYPVRIDIDAEDGSHVDFPYIEFRATRSGSKQVTLTNEGQAHPILVTQTVNFADKTHNFSFDRKPEPIAAPILLHFLTALRTIAKPCEVRITDLESGQVISKRLQSKSSTARESQSFFELVSILAAIQEKTGTPIYIPKRSFAEEELEVIGRLWWISQNPVIEAEWSEFTLGFIGKAGEEETILGQFGDMESKVIRKEEENATVELFGAIISLGRVRTRVEEPRLVNESAARAALASATEDIYVELLFQPGASNKMVIEYLDWQNKSAPN